MRDLKAVRQDPHCKTAALRDACRHGHSGDQVSDQVSDQVRTVLKALVTADLTATQLMKKLALSHKPTFRKNYLRPALDAGWIEMTAPESPRSPAQRYRITSSGRRLVAGKKN